MAQFKSGDKMVDTSTFSFFEDGQELGTSAATQPEEGHSEEPTPAVEFEQTSSSSNEEGNLATDNDSKRYEYHQSRADKFKAELDKIMPEYEQLKTYAPIARYLSENPTALEALDKVLNGNPPVAEPITPQENSIQAPVKPTKPANYNKYDAYNNEESESFKYREAYQEYQDQMLDYMQVRELERERSMQEAYARQQAEAQQAQQLAMTQQKLMAEYGYNRAEALEFVETFSKPEMFTLENLVKFHKTIQGKTFDPKLKLKEDGFANNPSEPTPAGIGGAESPKRKSAEEKINEAFLTMGKQKYF